MDVSRDVDSNIRRMTAVGTKSPVLVDVSGSDQAITSDIKAISSVAGSVIYVDIKVGDEATVEDVPIPAPGFIRITNIINIKNSGTDATGIVVWPDDEAI